MEESAGAVCRTELEWWLGPQAYFGTLQTLRKMNNEAIDKSQQLEGSRKKKDNALAGQERNTSSKKTKKGSQKKGGRNIGVRRRCLVS